MQRVLSALESEAVSISNTTSDKVCVVAKQDTWSRSARRKAARIPDLNPSSGKKSMDEVEEDDGSQRPPLLVAHVWVESSTEGENKAQLVVQWKRGHDAQAFEGFASHVGRKVREAAETEAGVK